MARKIKKSLWLPLVLFVYTTVVAVWFLPANKDMGDTEKVVTVVVSYLIIALLRLVLQRKERRMGE